MGEHNDLGDWEAMIADERIDHVTVWKHSRKGIIRGELIRDDGTWLTIRLNGDHHLMYGSEANRGRVDEDGSLIVVRASLMSDV